MAQVDAALEHGQRHQREQAEGQASFFDLLPPAAPAAAAEATALVPEWDDEQRLAFEKEVLGFYVSGHPLARYRRHIERLDVTAAGELAAKAPGSPIRLIGHVLALKETTTRRGSQMAFLTLEDMEGTVEVTVFPELFRSVASRLRSREPVLIRGRLDESDKGRVVLAEDVRGLDEILAEPPSALSAGAPHACRLRLPAESVPGALGTLSRLCEEHAGPVPLFVHVLLLGEEVVLRSRTLRVRAESPFVTAVEAILGPGSVIVDEAVSA
jgi:DNA polymerase-3 subunit alpha